jgi:hypothetical protein
MKKIAAAVFVLCLCAGALAQKGNSVLKSDKKQDGSIWMWKNGVQYVHPDLNLGTRRVQHVALIPPLALIWISGSVRLIGNLDEDESDATARNLGPLVADLVRNLNYSVSDLSPGFFAAFGAGSHAVKMAPLCASSCLAVSNKKWPVKHDGANLELVITDQTARIKQGEVTVLEIPAVSISEVGYDTSSHNPGWELLKDAGGLAGSGGEGGIVASILLAPAAILLPFKSTKHVVRILWEDKGNHSMTYLAVRRQDCHAVLDELQRLSGKPWVDLPKARKKLVGEIKQAKGRSVPLEIDRNIVLNGVEMKPGRYQAVFLERPGNHGEVYFFRGTDVNPERIYTHAVVNVETLNSETTNSGVTYVVEHGVETINAIQFLGKKLVFVSGALPVRVAK